MAIQNRLAAAVFLVVCVCAATVTHAEDSSERREEELHRLLVERRDTLRAAVDAMVKEHQLGRYPLDVLIKVETDSRDASLELATNPADRRAVHEKRVAELKQLEKRAGLLYDSGTGSTADVRLAKASRLQAEIDLLLATEMGESVLPNAEAISVPPDDKLRQLLVERRDSLNEYATLALIDFHRGWIRSTFVVQAQADSLMRA